MLCSLRLVAVHAPSWTMCMRLDRRRWSSRQRVQRFVQTLRLLTGLDSHVGKYACYSPEYDLAAATYRHSTAGVASADAYVSCFIESAEVFLDRRDASGALVPGLFPSLHTTFGAGAFEHGGPHFHDE